MTDILMPFQPKRAFGILNGDIIVDIRKTIHNAIPKCFRRDEPVRVWMYVKKTRPFLYRLFGRMFSFLKKTPAFSELNGLVVARFTVERVKRLKFGRWVGQPDWNYRGYNDENIPLFECAGFTDEQIQKYGDHDSLFALPITALEILEKPLPLTEFKKTSSKLVKGDKNGKGLKRSDKRVYTYEPLTRAPQSWCYVIPPNAEKGKP